MKRNIIKPGFCTLCGACQAACPIHAIKIEHDSPRRLHDCSEHLDFCPICYDICPHTDALLFETLKFVIDAPHRRENLGYYRKILLAQATDPTLRVLTKSAGVVNALLNFAIKEKIIDSAIVSEASSKVPIKIRPLISVVPDDTLSAVDTKMMPSAVADAFGRAVFEHGKIRIAFVGTPCQVLAIRKLEAWQHKLINRLQVTIGLFCLWTFSLDRLLEYLLHDYHIAAGEIQNVDLAAHDYVVRTKDSVVKIPLSEAESHIMNRCRTCADFTCELADLSVGGASPLQDWSIVIVRTEKGENLFNKAVQKEALTIREIEAKPETLAHLIHLSAHKRNAAFQEIETLKKAGAPVPTAVEFLYPSITDGLDILKEVEVRETMTEKVVSVPPSMTINGFLDQIAKHHHIGFPITDELKRIVGVVTLQDAMKVAKEKRNEATVNDVGTKDVVVVFPDNSMAEALGKMRKYHVGRLLVVDRETSSSLLGILSRSDVMHALSKYKRL